MKAQKESKVVYSECVDEIKSPRFADWGVHMLCKEGEVTFRYMDKDVTLKRNEAAVLSRPNLVTDLKKSADLQIEFVAAPFKFMHSLLPANHYGVNGCISLFDNPVIALSEKGAQKLHTDMQNIRERIEDTDHLFYEEMIGSVLLTMIFDLYYVHTKLFDKAAVSERSSSIVKRFIGMLEAGRTKHHREVSYYASMLHVTPKYLSEVVRRNTGRCVTYLIDQYTVPQIIDYLKNSDMSLTQISEEMNFNSLSYFSRYVTKHLGMNPRDYRRKNGLKVKG